MQNVLEWNWKNRKQQEEDTVFKEKEIKNKLRQIKTVIFASAATNSNKIFQ